MSNEQLYFDTLKLIAKGYMTTERLRRRAEKEYGVSYHEALEMSYDNIKDEAADAIRGKRRPKSGGAVAANSATPQQLQKPGTPAEEKP